MTSRLTWLLLTAALILCGCNFDFTAEPLPCDDAGACDLTPSDSSGETDVDCPAGQTRCSERCVDTRSDPSNCGACGVSCPGSTCVGGRCADPGCAEGELFCDGVCVDPTTSDDFCGATSCEAATPCPEGTLCNGRGVCAADCVDDLQLCGGFCVDTQSSPAHCGACGQLCLDNQRCIVGSCTCDAGWADCNDDPADGCESRFTTDLNNCGACGNACAEGAACVDGVCFRGVAEIAAGGSTACARLTTGEVYCWGYNQSGELGSEEIPEPIWTPVRVPVLQATAITVGGYDTYNPNNTTIRDLGHACAILEDTSVVCWGNNRFSQLGDGSDVNARALPGPVPGLSDVRLLDAGGAHTCALTNTALWCWGGNHVNQVTWAGGSLDYGSPVQVPLDSEVGTLTDLALGGVHTCALSDAGDVYCWGSNASSQLGPSAQTEACTFGACSSTAARITGLPSPITAIGAGQRSSCAVSAAGEVWCWGFNADGQLGSEAGDESEEPLLVSLPTAATDVDCGDDFCCATLEDASVRCWGDNLYSDLGIGEPFTDAIPPTPQSTGAAQVSLGDDYGCRINPTGTIQCWGRSDEGQTGNPADTACPAGPCLLTPTEVTLP